MNSPLLIRGSSRKWDILLAVLLGGGLFVFAWWANENNETVAAIIAVAVGVVTIGIAIGVALHRAFCWQTVEVEPEGFILRDRKSERVYNDGQIQYAAIKVQQNYANGTLKSRTRWFYLWMETAAGPAEPITMRNVIGLNESDPLAEFIDRVCGRLIAEAREAFDSGREVTTTGWTLTRDMIEIAARPEPLRTQLDAIEAMDVVGNEIAIWRRGDESAWAKIAVDTPNALCFQPCSASGSL